MKQTKVIITIGVVIGAIIIMGIILGSVNSYLKEKPQSVCGNGIIEKGETSENCCVDVGCPEHFECVDNRCINPSVNAVLAMDYNTIEATVLNISIGMAVVNNAGISGKLYGYFARIRVDKIINHTRYDPRNELGFDPLVAKDIINITLRDCSYDINDSKNISIGDKILINISTYESTGGDMWWEECN